MGSPAIGNEDYKKGYMAQRRLPSMQQRLIDMEKELEELKKQLNK
jgi:hypothetical protein